MNCYPFLRWIKFCGGCSRQVFFHLGDKKRWSLVALDKWSSYTVTVVWELAWADSALVVLDEWSSYGGGRLSRFDCRYTQKGYFFQNWGTFFAESGHFSSIFKKVQGRPPPPPVPLIARLYHRKCYQEYTHKQKLQRMVANTQVAVEQKKSRRESRTGGTCNNLLNPHSLLREICVGELLTPLVYICHFQDSTAYKTLQLPRAREFPLKYFKQLNNSVPIRIRSSHWRRSLKKGVLKIFINFIEKNLCWSLFLIKLQAYRSATLLKGDSNISVFL